MFGSWSRTQMALIGVAWPPKNGWKKQIVGKPIDEDDLEKFIHLKNKHITEKGLPGLKAKQREEYIEIAKRKQLI